MKPITIHAISRKEFDEAESIYKIISDDITNTHVYLELNNRKYYIGYPSSDIIKVELMTLEKENYLLIGVDLKVVVLCLRTGRILLALGLTSYFKGFENTDEFAFTIFSERNDYRIDKHHLSVNQIISHELEF
jgi:hypothetical protein